ncbi:MAG: SMC-Scp complex subunit ScpB [Anaerolineae bacterium]|nr:SMC-Scp complex subunit ScpB [Anaerolineae bacterium]
MSDSKKNTEISLIAKLEALLFVAAEPVSQTQLGTVLDLTPAKLRAALDELEKTLLTRGLRIQSQHGRVQLTTAPELAALIQEFLNLDATTRLSPAALEALSINAYQQPVTRPQVDAVRGVNSDGVMRSLLSKGLIEEGGRAEGPGRPILYTTTPEFLQHFGLSSLSAMPDLDFSEIEEKKEKKEKEEILKS